MEKKKILVIDDEVDIQELLKTRLELKNYYVIPCYTSNRAIEIALRDDPDLILLDIMMPDPDGYEVCKMLKAKKETKKTPIILFTAKESESKHIKDKCIEIGADDYILKPYEPEELMKKIAALLGGR